MCGLRAISSLVNGERPFEILHHPDYWTHLARHAEALSVLGGRFASCVSEWEQQYSTGQAESLLSSR